MLFRTLGLFLLMGCIAGCGSVRTLSSANVIQTSELQLKGTGCGDTLPRVYGGVVYNLCVMSGDGQQRGGALYRVQPLPIFDMGLSAVADTLALPYTLYRQGRDGDIQLLRD